MSAHQLLLFPAPRPMVDHFGEEFFRGVPTGPGVYFLCGDDDGVLYVGRARNLRRRLGSYRSAHPDRLPRRIFRLLFRVRRIYWDECVDLSSAMERERRLLLVLQPRYNRAGVWPRAREVLIHRQHSSIRE